MSSQIFINLPVSDLAESTAFYKALGFTKNDTFSDSHASCMMWSENIVVMLLVHDFYQQFVPGKHIIDAHSQSGVLLALSLDSKEAVQAFANTAKQLGGSYSTAAPNKANDQMFTYEVEDLDGHVWEPMWMDASFDPSASTS